MRLMYHEFRRSISNTHTFDGLIELYKTSNEDNMEGTGYRRLFLKTNGLATTLDQVIELWGATRNGLADPDEDTAMLEKMIVLAVSHDALVMVYNIFGEEEEELKRRHLIRRLFDKADQLDFPTL